MKKKAEVVFRMTSKVVVGHVKHPVLVSLDDQGVVHAEVPGVAVALTDDLARWRLVLSERIASRWS